MTKYRHDILFLFHFSGLSNIIIRINIWSLETGACLGQSICVVSEFICSVGSSQPTMPGYLNYICRSVIISSRHLSFGALNEKAVL